MKVSRCDMAAVGPKAKWSNLLVADRTCRSAHSSRSIAGCLRFFTLTQYLAPSGLIGPVSTLRHQPFQPQFAGSSKAQARRVQKD